MKPFDIAVYVVGKYSLPPSVKFVDGYYTKQTIGELLKQLGIKNIRIGARGGPIYKIQLDIDLTTKKDAINI